MPLVTSDWSVQVAAERTRSFCRLEQLVGQNKTKDERCQRSDETAPLGRPASGVSDSAAIHNPRKRQRRVVCHGRRQMALLFQG